MVDFVLDRYESFLVLGKPASIPYLSKEAERAFRGYLTRRMEQPRFANARSVRNELERARLRHAHRLASDLHRHWTRDDLMRIEPEDIFADNAELLLEDFQS